MNDIVLVLYARKVGKGEYKLGRVIRVHPDCHGVVRTVTVGYRRKDAREPALPYVSKALEEITLGIQRVPVICPSEDKVMDTGADIDGQDVVVSVQSDGQDVVVPGQSDGRDVNVQMMSYGQDADVRDMSDGRNADLRKMSDGRDANDQEISDVGDGKAREVSGVRDGVVREVSEA